MKKTKITMHSRREILAGIGLGTLGVIGLSSIWDKFSDNALTSTWDGDTSTPFPNVTVYTHEGKAVRFYDDLIRDKVVAINMMYAQCGDTCPKTTANLLAVQNMLGERAGRDVFMYSITLQPELDTPAVLKHYAENFGIQKNWKFLTGAPNDIELLRRKLGFFDYEAELDAAKDNHTGMVRIGNAALDRWSMAPSLADPEQIMFTINHLDPKATHTFHNNYA